MIIIETGQPWATVQFRPYSEQALKCVKATRPRHWDPDRRVWKIPLPKLPDLVERLWSSGERILLNGEELQKATAPTENPLVPLFRDLPVRLRQPTYRALSRVLHPDVGGSDTWMTRLNEANESCPTRRRLRRRAS